MWADKSALGILGFNTLSQFIMLSVAMIVSFAVLLVAVFGVCLPMFFVLSGIVIFTMPPMTGGMRLISRGTVFGGMVMLERGHINPDMSIRFIQGPIVAQEMVLFVSLFPATNHRSSEALHRVSMHRVYCGTEVLMMEVLK